MAESDIWGISTSSEHQARPRALIETNVDNSSWEDTCDDAFMVHTVKRAYIMGNVTLVEPLV